MAERRATLRAPRAFTLVELMMVVIVLSIVAALAIPDLRSASNRARLDGGARRIADLCDLGYRSAVGTGRVHALIFEGDRRHYALFSEGRPQSPDGDSAGSGDESADPNGPPELSPVDTGGFGNEMPEGVMIQSVKLANDVLGNDEGRIRILFFPDGTTEFATIILTDEHGDKRRIKLNGISGVVKVDEPSPDEKTNEEDQPPGQPPRQRPMEQGNASQSY